MTWSIVARDQKSGRFGIAISTCAFAVGAICPWSRAGVGALSTQAHTNPLHGPLAIDLMARGLPVTEALAMTLAHDAGREIRQVHGVDAKGNVFAHTGANCVDWCGHLTGENVTVAGNMLAGPAVVADTLARYEAGAGLEFGDRLLTALEAGEAAGGDKRGKQSAALLIQGSEPYEKIVRYLCRKPARLYAHHGRDRGFFRDRRRCGEGCFCRCKSQGRRSLLISPAPAPF